MSIISIKNKIEKQRGKDQLYKTKQALKANADALIEFTACAVLGTAFSDAAFFLLDHKDLRNLTEARFLCGLLNKQSGGLDNCGKDPLSKARLSEKLADVADSIAEKAMAWAAGDKLRSAAIAIGLIRAQEALYLEMEEKHSVILNGVKIRTNELAGLCVLATKLAYSAGVPADLLAEAVEAAKYMGCKEDTISKQ